VPVLDAGTPFVFDRHPKEIPMRIALVGAGAFGEKHLDGLKNIDGVEIASVISRSARTSAADATERPTTR
jgi:predicted dehydrogenase